MSRWTPRYHIQHGCKRTTVSLTPTLTQLLALQLGHIPDTATAQQAIRHWLQHRLDQHHDPERSQVSQWLQLEVVFALIDCDLYERHTQWLLRSPSSSVGATRTSSGY